MTLYVRAYDDYSYEVIYVDKTLFSKTRLHILVNPGRHLILPGQKHDGDNVEINVESLTHIVSMDTSVSNRKMISRTVSLAERTNKPIITNEITSQFFREYGLSIKQLRIIGFETEVVDGLQIDPVYLEELSDEIRPEKPQVPNILDFGKNVIDTINPLKWKPIRNMTEKITKKIIVDDKEEIDSSKPLAFHLSFGSKIEVLPLDRRGLENLNRIIPQLLPRAVIIPNKDVSFTKEIVKGSSRVIILNKSVEGDELLMLPKSYNPKLSHDTFYGALEEWIELE